MKVLIGVSGSISAYKAVDIMRNFQKNDHQVSVILTKAAMEFIAPLTFETFTPGKVFTDMFQKHQDPIPHITLSKENDLFLVAPATANVIGKMAHGIADDLLSSTFLAFYKRVVVAPAMNTYMYENKAVQENLKILKSRGIEIIKPDEGSLACKDTGKGKLPSPESIYKYCVS